VAAAGLSVLLSPALGGEGGSLTFSLIGGEGEAGGVAGVTLMLDNDDGAAVSAGVDIEFSDADLTFVPPVNARCTIAARLALTHQIAGRIIEPGVVNVEILVLGTPDPLPPLGNGPLAVCNFTIREDALEGEMFPVVANSVLVGDALGAELPANEVDGVITVVGAAATPTESEDTPTPTATNGEVGTETPTPTPVTTCTIDADCPTGTTCQEEVCLPVECTDDNDCPPGSVCEFNGATTSGTSPIGQCVPIECETDEDCPPRSVCDENGECRPEYCDDNEDCEGDDVCGPDGICTSSCENDEQCSPEVCVDGGCVECRDNAQCPGGICVNNSCMTVETTFSLAVSPASQLGLAGTTVSVEVVLSSVPAGAEADTVSNALSAGAGLALVACTVAAEVSEGSVEILDGASSNATLSGAPSGSLYACSVAIAAGPNGPRQIGCSNARVNGASVSCTGATIQVTDEEIPTPTPTEVPPTVAPTVTHTPVPPTNTPTPRMDFDDDGCAVAPVSANANPIRSLLFLLLPVALLWSRRR